MPLAIQRDLAYPTRFVPFLTTLLFALISVVPLNLPGFSVVTPALALMSVFHWSVYRPDLMPFSAVFVVGLLVDLLTGTPYVGISSLIFLLARAAVMSQRKLFVNRTFPIVWLGFLVLTLCAFILLWALVSVLHGATVGVRPFAFQAVLTVAFYPVGSYLLARAHRMFLAKD